MLTHYEILHCCFIFAINCYGSSWYFQSNLLQARAYEEIGVETVDYEFALGVREKCDEDTIYLVYEVDDGQLERNDKKLIVTANQNQLLIQLHVQAKLIGMVVTTTTNVMKIVTMKTKRRTQTIQTW